jgi:Galactose oxidase, central domain
MTPMKTQKVARILTITLPGLLAIGLAAATAVPALGQTFGTFASTGSMHTPRAFHTATLLNNGQVLVAGGLCSHSTQCSTATALASAELYNPATGQWTVTGSMSTARYEHTATLLGNGEVLVTGGSSGPAGGGGTVSLASAELYNPSTGTWSTTGSMPLAVESPGAALLQNGEVLVAGGSTYSVCGTGCDSLEPTAAAELYNPSAGTFTATASMNYARGDAQLTLLQNGEALIAGGDEGNAGCTSELFSNGHWSLTDLAFCGVTGDTAALLPNGDLLIAIGGDPGQFYSPSTNVWQPTLNSPNINLGPLASLATGNVLLAGGGFSSEAEPL